MRGMKKRNSNLIDQWDLIHCGIAAVRYTRCNPNVWISSFVSVNLHPVRMIPFADWCKKLEPFMQAADSFNLITQSQEIDEYTLLPALWQAMSPVDKKTAATIVQRFTDNAWGLDCCSALITALKIKMSDLTTLQPCIFLAIDNPSHLDRGFEEVIDRIVAGDVATKDQAAIAAIETIREKANTGLHMMQRNPDGVKGMDLFEHQVAFRQRAYSKRESEHKISDSLACSPRTSHQRSLMSVDYHLKIQGDLMADSGEAGFSLQKAAQVRLDNLGLVKNHSCFINNPKRIELLEQRLELQRSIGRSEEIRKSSALEKDLAEMDKLSPLLFDAIAMYKANETTKRGFTKDSIKSILLTVFGIAPPNSGKLSSKSEWLKLLQQQDKDHPGKIDSPVAANATADLGTAATQSNANIHWLYQLCQQAKVSMMTDVSPLGISLVVLRALRKIEIDIPESTDEDDDTDRTCEYANHFFDAFKDSSLFTRRDVDFMYELAENTTRLILDENLNEDSLAAQV